MCGCKRGESSKAGFGVKKQRTKENSVVEDTVNGLLCVYFIIVLLTGETGNDTYIMKVSPPLIT